MGRFRRADRPAPAPRFTAFDFRVIGLPISTIEDGGRIFVAEVPNEVAPALVDLLNLAATIATGFQIRSTIPNAEFVAHVIAKAMGGSIDFESFAEARRG